MSIYTNQPSCISQQLKLDTQACLVSIFNLEFNIQDIQVVETKTEFIGDYSIVIFALAKQLKQNPEQIANTVGGKLVEKFATKYKAFNVIKGFVNIELHDAVLNNYLTHSEKLIAPKLLEPANTIMVEFSSPNTNKPLHFGHMRNIFLGNSVCKILSYAGNKVVKANLLNDRGIHICKSMYAWMQDGKKATPENTGKKGDHLVGDFYVQFENEMKADAQILLQEILSKNLNNIEEKQKPEAEKLLNLFNNATDDIKKKEIEAKILDIAKYNTKAMQGTRKLLLDWENNDAETRAIWQKLNNWVMQGFTNSYKTMDIDFDKIYLESDTYLLGKKMVEDACAKNILFKKDDGSIWIDLSAEGYDQKLLLRADGTSVYMTQDIGTSALKYADYKMQQSIFVIADEQNYHMQVLQKTLAAMQELCAEGITHLSYGMVELPNGRMKTREGNVVDADDMVQEMIDIAAKHTQELGKVDGFTETELQALYKTIGLGALKFYLLRVDPKKRMIFNPEESIDFHGFTGPFVQYTYARINSILRKANLNFSNTNTTEILLPQERKLILLLEQFNENIFDAASNLNPSVICNYVFNVAKTCNGLLADLKILTAETENKKQLRINLCIVTKQVIEKCLELLGIAAPEKM